MSLSKSCKVAIIHPAIVFSVQRHMALARSFIKPESQLPFCKFTELMQSQCSIIHDLQARQLICKPVSCMKSLKAVTKTIFHSIRKPCARLALYGACGVACVSWPLEGVVCVSLCCSVSFFLCCLGLLRIGSFPPGSVRSDS